MDAKWGKLSPLTGWAVVVESNPTLRKLVVETLAEIDLQSLVFESADAALIFLQQTQGGCPLVIVDQGVLGRLQGTEFIELVNAKWPLTAAIFTSGYARDASILPSSTMYLEKPWSLKDLVMAVASLLQLGRPLEKTS
ncbi:response regulator [Pseudomonas frederiksbergensis]|uniref:Response regulator n=1 Tax=Pseudomonas frederiksbergensis TaxID=104087 RepID=A0A423K9I1_9PSED|nr:response regulator [Pseudomonas frederiksbergensis]RON48554.1 response regulator [Pseudomonas frederiksbergensis]